MKSARITVLTCLALLLGSLAWGASVTASLEQPASVVVREEAEGCHNNPGPFITMNGELSLGGVSARLILTNNRKWTHVTSEDITTDLTILEAGESISFAKQPSRGGVGGNPHIYFWFNDCNGGMLTEKPSYLGRCVQGLGPAALNFELPTDLEIEVASDACSNSPGPFITIGGELRLGGLCGTLIFTNQMKFTHVHYEDVLADIVLIEEGDTLTFPKSPAKGGAGGNPYIYLQILDGAGEEVGEPTFLGRCKDL